MDGDDWVNTEALIEVVRRLKTCGADYVVTDYCEVNDKTKEQVRKTVSCIGRLQRNPI